MGRIEDKFLSHLELAEKKLGIKFRHKVYLLHALTHPSYSHQENLDFSYEKLEFLGDAVINLIITDFLYRRFPELSEGELSKLKAGLVREKTLALMGERIGLDELLLIGRSLTLKGEERISLLGEAFEALVGAIDLDQGFDKACDFSLKIFGDILRGEIELERDFKSELQEKTLRLFGETPSYRIIAEEGPVHPRQFKVQVIIKGQVFGEGVGRSKKKAEQRAAEEALRRFEKGINASV